MAESIEEWLNGAEGIVIECEEGSNIDAHTLVSVTPLYVNGKSGSASGQRDMLLKEALNIKKGRTILKGDKLIAFVNSRLGKPIFD